MAKLRRRGWHKMTSLVVPAGAVLAAAGTLAVAGTAAAKALLKAAGSGTAALTGSAAGTVSGGGGIQTISPAAAWDGTAATGYGGSPPAQTGSAVLVQPYVGFMNGTKACNLNWIFNESFYEEMLFTDDVTLMVDGGDENDALTVTVYCEGNTVELTDRVLVDLPCCTGYDGSGNPTFGTKTIAAYAVTLDHSAFSADGAVDLYALAHSADAAVADRVIGPVRLYRRTDLGDGKLGYDVQKTIGTGGDYANLAAALAGHTTWWTSGQCVLLKYLNDATIDPSVNAFTTAASATNTKRGSVVVDADGHTVTGLRSTGNPNLWRPQFNGLVFKGMIFDLSNVQQLYGEDGASAGNNDLYRPMLCVRCEITAAGKYELAGGSPTVSNAQAKTVRGVSAWRAEVGRLSCFTHDMHTGDNQAFIETGCYQARTSGDLHLIGSASHRSASIFYNDYEDGDVVTFRNGTEQFTLYYTGAGTPGYRNTGPHNSSAAPGRKFILTVNGTDVDAGITLSTTFGAGVYSSLDLVNTINSTYGASGWVATSTADTYRAAMIGLETDTTVQAVGTSAGTATSVKGYAWLHMDGVQLSSSDLHDNHIVKGNEFRGVNCQLLFLSIQTTTVNSYNCLFENNVGMFNNRGNADAGGDPDSLVSQITGDHFNLMVRHNTYPNQGMLLRLDSTFDTDLDASNSFKNNVWKFLGLSSTVAGTTNDAHWENNIALEVPSGGYFAMTGTNVSGNITGSTTPLTEFPACDDVASSLTRDSFSPIAGGLIRSNPKTPAITRDIAGTVRADPSLCGALAA